MKQQRDTLKRYQQRVEKLLEKERELAKKLLSENKREYVKDFFTFERIFCLVEFHLTILNNLKMINGYFLVPRCICNCCFNNG